MASDWRNSDFGLGKALLAGAEMAERRELGAILGMLLPKHLPVDLDRLQDELVAARERHPDRAADAELGKHARVGGAAATDPRGEDVARRFEQALGLVPAPGYPADAGKVADGRGVSGRILSAPALGDLDHASQQRLGARVHHGEKEQPEIGVRGQELVAVLVERDRLVEGELVRPAGTLEVARTLQRSAQAGRRPHGLQPVAAALRALQRLLRPADRGREVAAGAGGHRRVDQPLVGVGVELGRPLEQAPRIQEPVVDAGDDRAGVDRLAFPRVAARLDCGEQPVGCREVAMSHAGECGGDGRLVQWPRQRPQRLGDGLHRLAHLGEARFRIGQLASRPPPAA